MEEVKVRPVTLDHIGQAIEDHQLEALHQGAGKARELLKDRTVWNINSTAQGGGVAEMLQPLLAYAQGLGVDVRWLVLEGEPDFFPVTKRIHNHLHGHPGDGGSLGDPEHAIYEATSNRNIPELTARIQPGDVVICHDPQTAGVIGALRRAGAVVIWRCHIGHDRPNELTRQAWAFLAPYLREADHFVFSRREYIPDVIDADRVDIIAPSIDPLSAKNQPLSPEAVHAILARTGLLNGSHDPNKALFTREDGTIGRVERTADIIRLGPLPTPDVKLVVQVSRWDHLKDPVRVMHGFVHHTRYERAALILAGPSVAAVADDPEGGQVLDEVSMAWRALPEQQRQKVHIVCLPMNDREENAAIVNALQRRADVVVQKSLQEGFGLTVTEAMWKDRPLVASAVGGIQDQIVDGKEGLLLRDPTDMPAFGAALDRLLGDPDLARTLGRNARARVAKDFLFSRHLLQYLTLLEKLLVPCETCKSGKKPIPSPTLTHRRARSQTVPRT